MFGCSLYYLTYHVMNWFIYFPTIINAILFQCLNQKSEVEKKLSSFTFQEFSTTDSNILVKHLQEEIRNYVSCVSDALCFFTINFLILFFNSNF